MTWLQRMTSLLRMSSRNLRHYVNIPSLIFFITLVITSYNLHETRQVNQKLTRMSSVRGLAGGGQDASMSSRRRGKQAWVKAKNVSKTVIIQLQRADLVFHECPYYMR